MIVVLVLVLFLSLTYYALDALTSASSLSRTFRTVYHKERAFLLFESLLPKVTKLLSEEDPSYDALTDPWARPFVYDTPVGRVEIKVVDEDRYLNPNYLGKEEYDEVFVRLLKILGIDPLLAEYLKVWTGKKAGSLDSPYPPKGAPLDSPYEIELFWPDGEDLYGSEDRPGLYQFITVFTDGKVNVNTAPIPVLMSLHEEIDEALARRIAERRKEKPFKRLKDLLLVEGVSLDLLYRLEDLAKVKSSVFRIEMELKEGDFTFTYKAVFDRKRNKVIYKEIR